MARPLLAGAEVKRMLAAFAAFTIATGAAASARTVQLDDIRSVVGVSDAAISPDGSGIAYIVSRGDYTNDRTDRTLMLYDLKSGTSRALTFERSGVASPSWSSDSQHLAFLAMHGAGAEAKPQVYLLDMHGGDPVQVTSAPRGVQQFALSPDGDAVAYVTEDEPANAAAAKRHVRAFVVGDESYLDLNAPAPNHLWIAARQGSGWQSRRLTSGAWSIPAAHPPGPPAAPLSWTPDGSRILFERMPTPYEGEGDRTTLELLDVHTGALQAVTGNDAHESDGVLSPDGTHIAYGFPHENNTNENRDIFVTGLSGKGTDVSSADTDANILRAIWMPDSKSLLLAADKGTEVALWLKPLDAPARRLNLQGVYPSAPFWLDASVSKTGAIAFIGRTANQPNELYYLPGTEARNEFTPRPVQLTNYNKDIAALQQGKAEEIAWDSEGFHEDGVITYPPGYDPAKRYPLVLVIHGGPTAASQTSFSMQNQILAAHGYVVFNPNYRGSDNLGNRYLSAIFEDSGAGPGRDVIAGIAALEKKVAIDPARIAVSGWSYGGYMTSWLEGHYHIWKTAVAGAAVNNLVDAYNLSDGNVIRKYRFHGSPWVGDNMKDYVAQSPLTYAWNITTPTLILSDTNDARVPITQSYEMFRTLRDRGTYVRFFAYPVAGHFPGDPVRALDVERRWTDWIVQYLK